MEKLNDYLQTLLSSCSYELHLEPNKNPYLVSAKGSTDVANAPLLGTQISMMVFPLIPNDVKMQLPNQSEVEFVHPHNLGNFNFSVKKSPAGFNVTIRPMIAEPTTQEAVENLQTTPPVLPTAGTSSPNVQTNIAPPTQADTYSFESASSTYESSSNIVVESMAPELEIETPNTFEPTSAQYSGPEIEIVSVNDPEFQTSFSDSSTYEPPAKRQEFESGEYSVPTTTPSVPADEFNFPKQSAPPSAPKVEVPPQIVQPQPQQFMQAPPQQFVQPQMPVQMYQAPTEFASASFVPAQANPQAKAKMDTLFQQMAQIGASDLHLSVSMPPMVRKDGKMQPLHGPEHTLTPDSMRELLTSIMPAKSQEEFARRNDADFAYEIPDLARFRANIFMDRKGMGAVFRIIPTKILTAQQLGLSPAIMNLCELSKGLVVVTGPTGSGKSTTLCAMVDHINKTRDDHIITIEDPIEFVHDNQKCLVNQREVHNHTDSFKDALSSTLSNLSDKAERFCQSFHK